MGIKEGLKRTNLKRSDIWITTKLWDDRYMYDCNLNWPVLTKLIRHHDVELGINETLTAMGLDYIDLYLLHFPIGEKTDIKTNTTTYAFDHASVSSP